MTSFGLFANFADVDTKPLSKAPKQSPIMVMARKRCTKKRYSITRRVEGVASDQRSAENGMLPLWRGRGVVCDREMARQGDL